ncbi:MAG: hypothetical protein ACFNZV_04560, partial [Rothia dentocariosa]
LTERYQGEESCEKRLLGKKSPLKALPVRPAKGPAAQKVYGHAHTYDIKHIMKTLRKVLENKHLR